MINISKYLAREFYLLKVKSILRDRFTLSLILYFLSSGASDHCVQESWVGAVFGLIYGTHLPPSGCELTDYVGSMHGPRLHCHLFADASLPRDVNGCFCTCDDRIQHGSHLLLRFLGYLIQVSRFPSPQCLHLTTYRLSLICDVWAPVIKKTGAEQEWRRSCTRELSRWGKGDSDLCSPSVSGKVLQTQRAVARGREARGRLSSFLLTLVCIFQTLKINAC